MYFVLISLVSAGLLAKDEPKGKSEKGQKAYKECKVVCQKKAERLEKEGNLGLDQTEGEEYSECIITNCTPLLYEKGEAELPGGALE